MADKKKSDKNLPWDWRIVSSLKRHWRMLKPYVLHLMFNRTNYIIPIFIFRLYKNSVLFVFNLRYLCFLVPIDDCLLANAISDEFNSIWMFFTFFLCHFSLGFWLRRDMWEFRFKCIKCRHYTALVWDILWYIIVRGIL